MRRGPGRLPSGTKRTMTQNFACANVMFNRKLLRHLYVAYAIMRQTYGGYTKFPLNGYDVLKGTAVIEGINADFLSALISTHGPKVVYFSEDGSARV